MSAAKDGPRDWDKELADIDKLIGGDPPPSGGKLPVRAAGGGQQAPGTVAPGPRPLAPVGRRQTAATWIWFLLALLLGVGLTWFWPYAKTCGNGLYAYLGSIGAFGIASLWSTVWSWRTRAAAVHFLSIALLGWAAFLGAREVLPRTGYAKQELTWRCHGSPAVRNP